MIQTIKFCHQNIHVQKSIMSIKRMSLAVHLTYPTPAQKGLKAKSCTSVLTSAESIAMQRKKLINKSGTRGEGMQEKERAL